MDYILKFVFILALIGSYWNPIAECLKILNYGEKCSFHSKEAICGSDVDELECYEDSPGSGNGICRCGGVYEWNTKDKECVLKDGSVPHSDKKVKRDVSAEFEVNGEMWSVPMVILMIIGFLIMLSLLGGVLFWYLCAKKELQDKERKTSTLEGIIVENSREGQRRLSATSRKSKMSIHDKKRKSTSEKILVENATAGQKRLSAPKKPEVKQQKGSPFRFSGVKVIEGKKVTPKAQTAKKSTSIKLNEEKSSSEKPKDKKFTPGEQRFF